MCPVEPCRKSPLLCYPLTRLRDTDAILTDGLFGTAIMAHPPLETMNIMVKRLLHQSQIHNHLFFAHLVYFYAFDPKRGLFACKPAGSTLLSVAIVCVRPNTFTLGLYTIDVYHQIIREADEIVAGDKDGFIYM